jgi:hypothetical protein
VDSEERGSKIDIILTIPLSILGFDEVQMVTSGIMVYKPIVSMCASWFRTEHDPAKNGYVLSSHNDMLGE